MEHKRNKIGTLDFTNKTIEVVFVDINGQVRTIFLIVHTNKGINSETILKT